MAGHQNILDAIKAGDAEAAGQYAAKHIRLYLKENLDQFTTEIVNRERRQER